MRRSHLENGNPKDESTPLVFFHGPLNIDSSFRRHLKNLKKTGGERTELRGFSFDKTF